MARKYSFRNSKIRNKLLLLMALNAGVALLLAGSSMLGFEVVQYRSGAIRELTSLGGIIGDSVAAALSFSDNKAAVEMLASLRGDKRIVQAVVYDRDQREFASYRKAGVFVPAAPVSDVSIFDVTRPGQTGAHFEKGALTIFSPISLRGEPLGAVYLRTDLSEEYGRMRRFALMLGLVLMASLGLALLFSSRVQGVISGPITTLAEVARRVSVEKNYSIRASKIADDEIGSLIDSFNEMLLRIETRDEARKAVEDALRESEERYALAANGANDGLWDWKLSTNDVYFSTRWTRMLGYSDDEVWSDPEEWFGRIHPADRDRVRHAIEAHCKGATPVFTSEYRIRTRNGSYIWVLTRGMAVRDAAGRAVRIAGSQSDITEGKVADPLTELPNRLYFLDKLENAIERFRNGGPYCFAVLFLDLDRFKLVNDSLGHAAGDQLLKEVAVRLRASVREADGAGRPYGTSTVARLGGDEFGILIEGIRRQSEAAAVAARILRNVEAPFLLAGRQTFANVSIGIAFSFSASTPEELLRNADTAMYRAKAAGKARFEVFDESMRERAVARMEIESDLRRAIGTGEFVVHYQPQISLSDHRLAGFEALIRWSHPQRGMIAPSEFISVAEETNLMIPLGRWVLREACLQMAAWQGEAIFESPLTIGVDKSHLTISVNLSHRQLAEPGLAEDVARILMETGLDARNLRLELTESAIMENAEITIATLRRLKQMNIGLELDDFGTGYSSLSYLRQLPFDTVKIDRSFIKEVGIDVEGTEIVGTILRLADSLNMKVVAEGIETAGQLARLTELGCEYGQGFYFSKALDAQEARKLIRAGRHEPEAVQWVAAGV